MKVFFENLFLRCTGYTYSNLARLFLRLFVGIMFIQFGIRHLIDFESICNNFPSFMGLESHASLIIMITIELLCSLLIMVGFLTRIAVLPPIVAMIVETYNIYARPLSDIALYSLYDPQPGYIPIMFIGIFTFIILSGPGKISLDYFISLFIISRRGKNEEEELEEV